MTHEPTTTSIPGAAPSPRPHATASRRMRLVGATIAALSALAVAGCGTSDETAASDATTSVAAPSSSPSTARTAPPTVSTPAPLPVISAPPAEPAPAAAAAAAPPAMMPNVVCMNLQAAQDTIQEAGVFFSRSRDATGADRRQLVDANWVVVAQTPLPGEPVTEVEAVLSAVKIGEPSPC